MIAAKKYIEVIGAESSAGINIEYDDDYLKLINMLQEKPEQQFGDLIIEAQAVGKKFTIFQVKFY